MYEYDDARKYSGLGVDLVFRGEALVIILLVNGMWAKVV